MKELRCPSLIILRKYVLTCRKTELAFFVLFLFCFILFFFSSGFFFTNIIMHRVSGEGGSYYFNCRELASAHSWQPDSNQKPSVSYRKSLSTKLGYPLKFAPSTIAMIADFVKSMLKTWVTLGDISLVSLNLIKIFIFVVFKLLPPMFTQLTSIFSL